MESLNEKRFYAALGEVPDVPAGILENVERSVRRSGVKRRIAVAACLLLALIIPAVVITQQVNTSIAYADEYDPMDELLYAFEFMSGWLDTDFLFGSVDSVAYSNGANGGNGDGQLLQASELSEEKLTTAVAKKETINEN
jgi:hypothetical protein